MYFNFYYPNEKFIINLKLREWRTPSTEKGLGLINTQESHFSTSEESK